MTDNKLDTKLKEIIQSDRFNTKLKVDLVKKLAYDIVMGLINNQDIEFINLDGDSGYWQQRGVDEYKAEIRLKAKEKLL